MVKIAFVVEGDCEMVMVNSRAFQEWCARNDLHVVAVMNAGGGGVFQPGHVPKLAALCRVQGADRVVLLVDLEDAPCITMRKTSLGAPVAGLDVIVIAVRAFESWLLADSRALSSWLKQRTDIPDPEDRSTHPWERLKELARAVGARGPGSSHLQFARKMMDEHGFDVAAAAQHPACPSAAYLLRRAAGG
jgi:hypothetical protein